MQIYTDYTITDNVTTIKVGESPDCPGLTEIKETSGSVGIVTIKDADLPALIDILTRRYNDTKAGT